MKEAKKNKQTKNRNTSTCMKKKNEIIHDLDLQLVIDNFFVKIIFLRCEALKFESY